MRSKEYITLLGHVHHTCGLYTEDDIKWLETGVDKFWRKDLDTNIIT